MSGLLLFAITLILLLVLFAFLASLKRPVYQLTRQNVISLLELVLAGEASEDDWNVFSEMPIRYNDDLEAIRQKCLNISENDSEPMMAGRLFSERALNEISEVLTAIRARQD